LNFARPELLWLLMILPGLVVWAVKGRRRRARGWLALAQRGRVPRDGTVFVILCVACLIMALAQPRWGQLGAPSLPPGHDVVLMVDVSRSMGVEDAVPNRLAVAVEAAQSLVNALAQEPANRAAVVAFAGRGELRCPLTENLGAVLDALGRLRPAAVRPGGTDLGAGLDAARDVLGPEEHAEGRTVVIFSDGEDNVETWSSRLDRLRREDIVVHAVAIGDPDKWHPVPSGKSGQPLTYHGEPVFSRRSDIALESIVRRTDGTIVRLGLSAGDLGNLYQTKIEPAARRRRESSRITDQAERFPLLLIAALTFLLAGCWPARRGWSWPWSWSRSIRNAGVTSLCVALAGLSTGADDASTGSGSSSAAQAVLEGLSAYGSGQFDEAQRAFDTAITRAPGSAVPRYNAAAALFQLGRFTEARQRYREARERADDALRTKIDFALGNTALAEGDIPGAIHAYDDCLASTARGAGLDAVRRDAAINRLFALEQPQSLAVPQDNNSGDRSESRKLDRRKSPNRRGDGPSSQGQPESEPESGAGTSGDDNQGDRGRPPTRRRRMGGAGGGGTTPPGARGDTPEDRLDAALEHIRAAQSRRLIDEDPPLAANDDRKDW